MSNEELKEGDLVYVSEKSEEQTKEFKIEAMFIAKTDKDLTNTAGIITWPAGTIICYMPKSGEIVPWNYAVKAPKPKLVPWTFETAPRLPFAIKPVSKPDTKHEFVVTEKTTDYLYSSNSRITYISALKHHQWLDGEEWKPCGVLEE